MAEVKRCPACGEPVEPGWKICPACEASLISLLCPQCRRPVKGNWKRCPECEARLLCPSCGRRLEKEGCDPCRRGKAPLGPGGDTEFVVEPVTGM